MKILKKFGIIYIEKRKELKFLEKRVDASYASGLHFSNANYWNRNKHPNTSTFLAAKIKLDDIITVQDGKIRCKKAFIIGKYDIQ